MSNTETYSGVTDAGRCPRCKKFVVAEQLKNHTCKIKAIGVREVYLDSWVMKDHINDDGDALTVAMGLDGHMYRLIVCGHNPPHNIKRIVKALVLLFMFLAVSQHAVAATSPNGLLQHPKAHVPNGELTSPYAR